MTDQTPPPRRPRDDWDEDPTGVTWEDVAALTVVGVCVLLGLWIWYGGPCGLSGFPWSPPVK